MSTTKDQIPFDPTDTQSAREAAEARAASEGALKDQGADRREDLALKAEKLIAAAAKLLEQIDVEVADTSNLEIEREVRAALNEMTEVYISNQQPEFAYCWQYRDPTNEYGGRFVRKMQALGWELVVHDMPEAREHRTADGTRVVSDCLLMRIRLDRQLLLEKRDRLLREAQQVGISARIHELAERAGTRVYDKLPGFVEDSISTQAESQREARRVRALRDFHRLNRGGRIDDMLRRGQIPGIPSPGAGD
jgi:hypothetical protein